jgi:hypothetical protein
MAFIASRGLNGSDNGTTVMVALCHDLGPLSFFPLEQHVACEITWPDSQWRSGVSFDGMSITRSERYQEYLNAPLFTLFHVLCICCPASVQSVDPLPEHHFQSVNADFFKNCSDSRKQFIYRPELLSLNWRAFLRCPNKKTRQARRS